MIYLTLRTESSNFIHIDNAFNTVKEGLNQVAFSDWIKDNARKLNMIEITAMESSNVPTKEEREEKAIEGYVSVESKHLPMIVEELNKEESDKEFYQIVLNAELENLAEELEEALEFDNKPLIY